MHNIISNKKEEITETKKINESKRNKKYHFKVLFTFQNIVLVPLNLKLKIMYLNSKKIFN